MGAELLGVFFAASPGLIGLLVAAAFAGIYYRSDPGLIAVLAGIGGVLGYVALALFIRWRDAQGAQVFTPALLPTLWILTTFALACFIWVWAGRGHKATMPQSGLETDAQLPISAMFGVVFLAVLVGQTIVQVAISPVSSWDGLGLWTGWAEFFLKFELDPEGWRGRTRAELGAFPLKHPRHPPTVYHLSAFSGFALAKADLLRGWLVPWSVIWLCGAMTIWGFVRAVSGERWLGVVAAYLFLALPLLGNHAVLVGYADVWVAAAVTSTAALVALALHRRSWLLGVSGLLVATMPLLLKNTGIFYTAATVLPLIVVMSLQRSPRVFFALLAVLLGLAVWLWSIGFDVSLAGQRYALVWGETSQLVFGSYTMAFSRYPLTEMVWNEFWALFVNQSFSLALMLGAVGAWLSVQTGASILSLNNRQSLVYLLLVALALLAVFMLPQLLAESYAEGFAVPQSDTGNSRFLMAVGPVLVMTLAFWPKAVLPVATRPQVELAT